MMILSDKPEFSRTMAKLAKIFPRELDDDVIDAYWETLKGFSLLRIKWGFRYIQDTREYRSFPVPAEVYRGIMKAIHTNGYGENELKIGMEQ